MSQTTCILFDADGVVIDKSSIYQSLSTILNYEENELRHQIEKDIQLSLIDEADLKDIFKKYAALWGWSKPESLLIDQWLQHVDAPNMKLLNIIKQLKKAGFSCFLTSNKEKYRAKYLYEKNNFNSIFNHCFFSYEIHSLKPSLKYFQYVWDSLQYLEDLVDKQSVIFWDDTQKNIDYAIEFGFDAHLFSDNHQFQKIMNKIRVI